MILHIFKYKPTKNYKNIFDVFIHCDKSYLIEPLNEFGVIKTLASNRTDCQTLITIVKQKTLFRFLLMEKNVGIQFRPGSNKIYFDKMKKKFQAFNKLKKCTCKKKLILHALINTRNINIYKNFN